jgi:hypothetical protein
VNISELVTIQEAIEWKCAAQQAYITDIPQFTEYHVGSQLYIALIKKFYTDVMVIYEIRLSSNDSKKKVKQILLKTAEHNGISISS